MSILPFAVGVYILGALHVAIPLVALRKSWVKFNLETTGKPPNWMGEIGAVVLWPVFSGMRAITAINNARNGM